MWTDARIAALDIGGTAIKSALWQQGVLSRVQECPTPVASAKTLVEKAVELLRDMGPVDAVGVCTRGQVDGEGRILHDNGPVPDYTGTPLQALLEDALSVPVLVENDTNAAAWGEARQGAGRGCADFLCLTFGTAVGGGLILNDRLYRGVNRSAGEFGCMQLFSQKPAWEGPGGAYYETMASTTALVKAARQVDPTVKNGRELCARLDEPNLSAVADHWVEQVSWGLSSLIHIFNPALLVLGGGIMQNEALFRRIDACVRSQLLPGFEVVTLKPALLGNRAGLIGVALLAEEHIRLTDRKNIVSASNR